MELKAKIGYRDRESWRKILRETRPEQNCSDDDDEQEEKEEYVCRKMW